MKNIHKYIAVTFLTLFITACNRDEIAEVKWVSINEINLDEIGFYSLRKVVEIYINSLNN